MKTLVWAVVVLGCFLALFHVVERAHSERVAAEQQLADTLDRLDRQVADIERIQKEMASINERRADRAGGAPSAAR